VVVGFARRILFGLGRRRRRAGQPHRTSHSFPSRGLSGMIGLGGLSPVRFVDEGIQFLCVGPTDVLGRSTRRALIVFSALLDSAEQRSVRGFHQAPPLGEVYSEPLLVLRVRRCHSPRSRVFAVRTAPVSCRGQNRSGKRRYQLNEENEGEVPRATSESE
jgi:hypothetical protein